MELELIFALGMFLCAIFALLAGYPVALTLGGVALIFGFIGVELGLIPLPILRNLPSRILGSMENQVLIAVPLFVLMGVILERSKVADDLLQTASRLLAHVRGGLGYAVVIVGALLAASTGIVGATVITMTLIALPTMLRQGYDPKLATGTIAASGTLGQIIPPSIVLILLADAVSNANQAAAMRSGNGAGVVSVGDLFAGALVPGILLVGLYLLYLFITAMLRPSASPAAKIDETLAPLSAAEIARSLGAPLLLIIAVLGSILAGLASPTEASAIGAGGALLLAGLRLAPEHGRTGDLGSIWAAFISLLAIGLLTNFIDLTVNRESLPTGDMVGIVIAGLLSIVFFGGLLTAARVLIRAKQFRSAITSGAQITSMVFLILIGASLFALVFRAYGGEHYVEALLTSIPGGLWGALAITMLVMFILGFFLDFIEIVFVVVPIIAPPLIILGADPIWLAILMALNLQTSFLTPPFGFALFYLRGAAPDGVETMDIWRGAIPFIGLQLIMIALVAAIPALATWLPTHAG
ncbi:MAG: TRAP transporter large permease subunit [Pseudomonadota bacterium]|nr:TRAP transporter large permease subunit [Pseudomonadota bacterium]